MMDEAFRSGGEIEPGQVGAERTVAPAAVAIPSSFFSLLFSSVLFFFSFFLAASATEIV